MESLPLTLITNDTREVFQQLVIAGAGEAAAAHGYSLRVIRTDSPELESFLPAMAAGILSIANAAPPDLLFHCHTAGIPVSLVADHLPDLTIPAVMFNNAQGVQLLVRHLVVDCQRENLLYIGGIADQIDGQQRELAFRREMMRYNLSRWHLLAGEFDPAQAAGALRQAIAAGRLFDGILAADYRMAIAAVETLRAADIRVAEQVAVVGFGDAPEAAHADVTTVAADVQELGRRSALQLICQLKGLPIRGMTQLSVHLIQRGSSTFHEAMA